jgi:hypothetical protein
MADGFWKLSRSSSSRRAAAAVKHAIPDGYDDVPI